MKIHEPIRLRIHAHGEEAWSALHEAFESKQQISIGGHVFATTNTSRKMEDGKIFDVTALLSELAPVKVHSGPSDNPLITALRACVGVMERDLGGLHLIQPELRQAREALAAAEAQDEPWGGEGLPPVGTVCEARMTADWVRVQVMYLSRHTALLRFFTDDGDDCEGAYSPKDCQFRPIRTPEQIEAEEREQAIQDLYFTVNWSEGRETWPFISKDRKADYAKAIDAGYRKQVAP